MASNPVKFTDIFDPEKGLDDAIKAIDLFEKTFKDAMKSINKEAKKLDKTIEKLDITDKKDQKELIQLTKQVEKLTKERDKLTKANKKAVTVRKKLNKLTEEQIKEKIKLQETTKENNKQIRDEIQLTNAQEGSLKKLRLETNKLVKQRDALNKETIQGRQEFERLTKIIAENTDELKGNDEQIGRNNRNVGNYTESIKDALGSSSLFSDELGKLKDVISKVSVAFKKNEENVDKTADGLDNVSKSSRRSSKAIRGIGKALKASGILLLIAAIASIGAVFNSTREGAIASEKAIKSFGVLTQVIIGRLAIAGKGLIDIFSGLFNVLKAGGQAVKFSFKEAGETIDGALDSLSKGADQISGAFTNLSGALDDARNSIKDTNKLIETEFRFADEIRELNRELIELRNNEEILQLVADDATRSFKERNEALEESINVRERRIKVETEIAEKELELANERLRIELVTQGLQTDNIKELINNENLRLKVGEESLQKQQEAILRLAEIRAEDLKADIEATKIRRELRQDELERDLDILIDGFDNQKTINERRITDERRTFEERQKILDDTTRLARESFEDQKEILAELSDAGIDVDELLGLDAVALQKQIRLLEQSEIIEGRTLEVVRERRIVLQDLADAQKDLDTARLESLKNILASEQAVEQENLKFQEENIQRLLNIQDKSIEEQIELIEELFDIRREQVTDQAEFEADQATIDIVDAEERAAKLIEIENKKNNDLERIEIEAAERRKAILDKEAEDRSKLINSTINDVLSQIQKTAEAQQNAANESISRTESRIDKQAQLAQEGLKNTLAFEQKALADAESARIEAEKKARRAAKTQALFNAYSAKSADPSISSGEALTQTLRDFAILEGIAASFGMGGIVSDVLDVSNKGVFKGDSHNAKSGGIPIMVEGDEGILSTKEMGNLGKSNFYALKDKLKGSVGRDIFSDQVAMIPFAKDIGSGEIVMELRAVQDAVKNIPQSQIEVAQTARDVVDIIQTNTKKGKVTKRIYRTRI